MVVADCFRIGHIHVDSFHDASGSGVVDGKTYHWDFSERFGPLFTDAGGKELKVQPGPRTKAFRAFQRWHDELKQEQLAGVGHADSAPREQ